MKNILLTAKFLSSKDGTDKITLDNIKDAIKTLEFNDDDTKKKILKYLKIKKIENNQLVTEDDLKFIANKPKISYDEKVKQFIDFLKSIGLSTNIKATKLYIEESVDNYVSNAQKLIELGAIKATLAKKIFDQDIAIESVKDVISRAIFEERENAVKAILFFVGPPATGKTYLSEQTGHILEKYDYKTKIFNMTMYSEDSSNLTGLASPMSGAGKGDLTKFIEEHPKSLIVFDEIEKCHIQKQQDLFRLLDRGYIEDKYDNSIINANECILIFTSNLGKDIYDRNDYSKMIIDQQEIESLILQSIAKEKNERDSEKLAITPPLTSRLSAAKIILFNKVGLKAYFQMSKNEIERYFKVIEDKFGVKLKYGNEVILSSFLKYLPFFDPRRVKGKIGDDLFDSLRDHIQENSIDISRYNTLEIKVSDELQDFLNQNFIKNIDNLEFNNERFLELIDKKQTLFLDTSFREAKTKLILTLTNPQIEKIKNIQDFDGDVKIELDIPSDKIEGEPNAKIFGHDDAKKMLVRIANKIQKFQDLRRKNDPNASKVLKNIPKGILLYGPPGTGKTKLARAFAAQVEVPIIVSSGKDMTTIQYTGTGIKKIKDIFKKAREYAPSVLFIDEIDAIGTRGQDIGGEQDKNINALLEELDGFSKDEYKPVFIISATNRKDRIDPAIIRSGRIEEHIKIPSLSKEAREEFIHDMFSNDSDFSKKIDVKQFLKYTVGMNGAKLEQVFKKAKYNLEIKKEEQDDSALRINLEMLIDVVNEIEYGAINKSRVDAKFENMLTAYHEAGHAITSMVLNPSVSIEQITITPRSNFGGFVSYNYEEVYRQDKTLIKGMISSAYGGRVAEELYFEKNGEAKEHGVSSGASQDIAQATIQIKRAILELGMDEELGLINYTTQEISEETKEKIDKTIQKWQKEMKESTVKTLNNNWDNVEKIVLALIGDDNSDGKETIDGAWLENNLSISK